GADRLELRRWHRCVARRDLDLANLRFQQRTNEIDIQQSVVERGAGHLDAVGQDETALELPRGDAAVQEHAAGLVALLAAGHQLVVLDLNRQILARETGDRQRDAEAALAALLDIVGRVALASLADAIERAFELLEAQQERMVKQR